MGRVQLLQVRVAIFAESERLTTTVAPGHIDRAAGFEPELVARVRTNRAEEKLELIEAARHDFLQVRHLPQAPSLMVLFGQLSHRYQYIHHADVTLALQELVGNRIDFGFELVSIHMARWLDYCLISGSGNDSSGQSISPCQHPRVYRTMRGGHLHATNTSADTPKCRARVRT